MQFEGRGSDISFGSPEIRRTIGLRRRRRNVGGDLGIEWPGVWDDGREVAEELDDSAGLLLPGFFLFRFLDYFDEFLAALGDFGHAFVAFEAALLQGEPIVVGEDAEEVLEQGGTGIGIGSETNGALLDDVDAGLVEVNGLASEETEKVLDGRRVVFGDVELIGEVESGAIAVEAMTGERDAVTLEDEFLGVGDDDIANDVVNFREVSRGKLGELGEDLEGGSAMRAAGATGGRWGGR